jgi:hypothetical protein
MTIRNNDNAEKLISIKASGRKYSVLSLEVINTRALLLDVIASIGWNLKELEVSCTIDISFLAQLLSTMCNLETLSFQRIKIAEKPVKLSPLHGKFLCLTCSNRTIRSCDWFHC